jgi:alkyldihydroxyacetonephosphate synthase
MADRLKFIGWGNENTGFDETERTRLFRFVADRLGIEPRLIAAPRIEEISLPPPRVAAPAAIAQLFTADPYERLLHTYGKSYPETVRAAETDPARPDSNGGLRDTPPRSPVIDQRWMNSSGPYHGIETRRR